LHERQIEGREVGCGPKQRGEEKLIEYFFGEFSEITLLTYFANK
jgi:hypothetical protein